MRVVARFTRVGAASFAIVCPSSAVRAQGTSAAAVPRDSVSVRVTTPIARRVRVKAGDDLQRALAAAKGGDVLMLDAGATFAPIVLPTRAAADSAWITIRSAASDSALPGDTERVTPRYAAQLARIATTSAATPAISAPRGAHHYRLLALEITTGDGVTGTTPALVALGDDRAGGASDNASSLILDRVYVHGREDGAVQRCVAVSSARTAIVNSTIAACHATNLDSEAILVWNGPGPYRIENDYLEGAGANLLVGGSGTMSPPMVPSDITIRRNHLRKPVAWTRSRWTSRDLIELTLARRVLVEGNVLDGAWTSPQGGWAVLVTTVAGSSASTEDVTLRFNRVRDVGGAFSISGSDAPITAMVARTQRVAVHDNVVDAVNVPPFTGSGRFMFVSGGAHDVAIDHNTMTTTGALRGFLEVQGDADRGAPGLVFTRNIVTRGQLGAFGGGEGTAMLEKNAPGYLFADNVIIGHSAAEYPRGTMVVPRMDDVFFENAARGDYRLARSSPYRRLDPPRGFAGAEAERMEVLVRGVVLSDESPTVAR